MNRIPRNDMESRVRSKLSSLRGKLLAIVSETPLTTKSRVRVECKRQHIWTSTAQSLLSGHWCTRCALFERTYQSFESVASIVRSRGGEILSPMSEFQHLKCRLRFRCSAGHEWSVRAGAIKEGYWCRKCFGERRRLDFAAFLKPIEEKGFQCLTQRYQGTHNRIKFKCPEGHIFQKFIAHIRKTNGVSCPKCNLQSVYSRTLERLRSVARKQGGKVISAEFLGWHEPHVFQCAEGHRWTSAAANVIQGAWCGACYHKSHSFGLEVLHELALERGGTCLSQAYDGVSAAHKWRCAEGHEFDLSYFSARKGAWCPVCQPGKTTKANMARMQAMAAARGGRCLSTEYVNNRTKLYWECSAGHRFSTRPNCVQQGIWCPTCSRKRTSEKQVVSSISSSCYR